MNVCIPFLYGDQVPRVPSYLSDLGKLFKFRDLLCEVGTVRPYFLELGQALTGAQCNDLCGLMQLSLCP